MTPPGPRALRSGVAGLVLLLAAAGLTVALRHVDGPPPAPVAAARTTLTPASPAARPATPAGGPARSLPVTLRIPALGLAVPLTRLGLNPDRTVEVPTDYARAGWFRLGPTPGQLGSAVILGHVDSYAGPAVFSRLRTLRPGDRVEVTLADGTVARFAVRSVETYLKRDFPARRVYGSHGRRELQLVTCGGEFDRTARSYRSNVVAYTTLVGTRKAVDPGS